MSGQLRAAVFDWAGTVQDHGSRAPVAALTALFRTAGIELTEAQARGPMGRFKLDHIRDILAEPQVAAAWLAASGSAAGEADALRLYDRLGPIQEAAIADHGELIDGVVEVMAACRERGLRIGSTTGYPRASAEIAAREARRQGYVPDAMVCSDDVPAGRPAPWMLFRNLELLGAYPPWRVVKVGDTAVDIAEGRNAGTWTVGVTRTGNLVGRTHAELAQLKTDERQAMVEQATAVLRQAGADAVVQTVADLIPVLDAVDGRIARGERPHDAHSQTEAGPRPKGV